MRIVDVTLETLPDFERGLRALARELDDPYRAQTDALEVSIAEKDDELAATARENAARLSGLQAMLDAERAQRESLESELTQSSLIADQRLLEERRRLEEEDRARAAAQEADELPLEPTDQPLDMAINGRGFFEILQPDGNIAYTRNGEFHLSADGEVVTADGLVLQPAITVPQGTLSLTIGRDGTVSALQAGNPSPTQVGSIQLSDFINPAGLQAIGSNLFLETASSGAAQQGTPGLNGFGSVEQGTVENSNVNVVEELVNMITTQRTYEMNSKVIDTADQMLQFLSQTL